MTIDECEYDINAPSLNEFKRQLVQRVRPAQKLDVLRQQLCSAATPFVKKTLLHMFDVSYVDCDDNIE